MKRKLVLLAITTAMAISVPMVTYAQENQCDTGSFVDVGNGEVKDSRTGLVWQRCSMGQTWTGSTCKGTPQLFTTRTLESRLSAQGYRLPTFNELNSLVQSDCASPKINSTFFPNTFAGEYWSSTLKDNRDNVFKTVDFRTGKELSSHKDNGRAVRGVRK